MKTHIINKSGYGTICKTKNRVVAISSEDFVNLSLEFQCKKCLSKISNVTSFLNTSKKTLNNKNDAFALMPNKSLKNRYAITGLQTDIYKPSFRCDITS